MMKNGYFMRYRSIFLSTTGADLINKNINLMSTSKTKGSVKETIRQKQQQSLNRTKHDFLMFKRLSAADALSLVSFHYRVVLERIQRVTFDILCHCQVEVVHCFKI
mmetsp:Transcript_7807/g.11412  ORF Transcript_7807/g.11412 Transcript_7807/m.11412 type:complete len:106 (-) Transcript_7807:705-1022(-)